MIRPAHWLQLAAAAAPTADHPRQEALYIERRSVSNPDSNREQVGSPTLYQLSYGTDGLDCLLAFPRCGVASGWSKFSSKWLNKKFVQFSSPASSRWWTVRSVQFGPRRLSDSVQFVQFSSRTVPALSVTLTLAGNRYYNILDSTRGDDVTPSSLAPDVTPLDRVRTKAPVKKQRAACYGMKLMIPEFKVLRQPLRVRLVSLRSDLWPENDISKVNRGLPRSFYLWWSHMSFFGLLCPLRLFDASISHLKFIFSFIWVVANPQNDN